MRVERIRKSERAKTLAAKVDLTLIEPVIKKYKGKKGNLIPLLQAAQNIYGYIPEEVFRRISVQTGLRKSDLYGVATFYAQFRLSPVGKNIIKICHGTACHVQNANKVTEDLTDYLEIKSGETTEDGVFTLETVACLGCCSLAPVMMIGNETYGKLTGKKAVDIVKEIRRKESLKIKELEKVNLN
jgi:NADH-quinone oxidoreductase subunit E